MPTSAVYSDDQLLAELRRVAALTVDGPITQTRFAAVSTISPHTLLRRFGGWRPALTAAGLDVRYSGRAVTPKMRHRPSRDLTDDELLGELRTIASRQGRGWITKTDVHQSERIGLGVILARFGSWPGALEKAGLTLSPHAIARTERDLLDNLQLLVDTLGRFPRTRELSNPPSTIRYPTYLAHYGSWAATRAAYLNDTGSG